MYAVTANFGPKRLIVGYFITKRAAEAETQWQNHCQRDGMYHEVKPQPMINRGIGRKRKFRRARKSNFDMAAE